MNRKLIYTPTGEVYGNRKEAKTKMGHSNYNRALNRGDFKFIRMYKPLDIII